MGFPVATGLNVLVTGGTGFIGGNLVRRLAPDNRVTVLSRNPHPQSLPHSVETIVGDIRSRNVLKSAVSDVDAVFHLAADTGPYMSSAAENRAREVNVDAGIQLLELLRGMDTRVVIASSAAVYGSVKTMPIHEETPTNPLCPYGRHKLTLERHAQQFEANEGVSPVVLRYFNVYGPAAGGNSLKGLPEVFIEQARSGGPVTVYGDGTQTRDFVHMSDVIDATIQASTFPVSGGIYNIGTGVEVQISALAESIASAFDVDVVNEKVPQSTSSIDRSVADIERAVKDFDFEPAILSQYLSHLGSACSPVHPTATPVAGHSGRE